MFVLSLDSVPVAAGGLGWMLVGCCIESDLRQVESVPLGSNKNKMRGLYISHVFGNRLHAQTSLFIKYF